jgi:hypothetical protein
MQAVKSFRSESTLLEESRLTQNTVTQPSPRVHPSSPHMSLLLLVLLLTTTSDIIAAATTTTTTTTTDNNNNNNNNNSTPLAQGNTT